MACFRLRWPGDALVLRRVDAAPQIAVPPLVADDPIAARVRAGGDRRVTRRGHRERVVLVCVREHQPVGAHAGQARVVLLGESRHEVGPHLIDDDDDH